ncbi:MAG: DUF4445 domain-containing protein [Clostridia bacterium]|nr:DUF4445 domain-containing protein [Clostridia bacterium]
MKNCTLTIIRQNTSQTITAEVGESILDILARADHVTLDAPCGGNGTCGKCRVSLTGEVSSPTEHELTLLGDKIKSGIRLACLTKIEGNATVTLAAQGETVIQTEGERSASDFTPLPGPFGLAVDIGTTTVACYLCDLRNTGNKRIAAVRSFMNPQKKFGADVISRIGHVIENEAAAEELRAAITDSINEALLSLTAEVGITPGDIGSAAITGNTVMQHFFCGDDARGIANAPFTPSSLYGYTVSAASAGIHISPAAEIYMPPCFAAYVGGDIASGIIASGVDLSDGLELFIDIGTNGEMGLGNRDAVCLCATAAGPAFEGAHIAHGMAGIEGAINTVTLDDNGGISYSTIGDVPPKGICGSGLIDAVACMLELEVLDETGYLEDDFILDEESGVCITDKDIRELQLAKASVCAGVLTLLAECGKTFEDVTRVVIAGGFGAHINAHNACRIGLIPPELEDKIVIAGNTAGMGAVSILESASARERTAALPAKSRYLELSCNATFMEHYVEQMMFE